MRDPTIGIRGQRVIQLGHHLRMADKWLTGVDSISISYAAFELRLEIECVGIELYKAANQGDLSDSDLAKLTSYNKSEKLIYDLEGNQKEINKNLEFLGLLFEAAGIRDFEVIKPDWRKLRSGWDLCCNYCHASWTYLAARNPSLAVSARLLLEGVSGDLRGYSVNNLAFPAKFDAVYLDIRAQYIAGTMDREAVIAYFRRETAIIQVHLPGQSAIDYPIR